MVDKNLLREIIYKPITATNKVVLAGDIGGTNSNFGIFSIDNDQITLHASFHYPSQKVTDFTELVDYVLKAVHKHFGITIHHGCIGAAGVVAAHGHVIKPTNLPSTLDANVIMAQTSLEYLIFINDFEAIMYGLDKIAPRDLIVINQGTAVTFATKACIGAGTGLGKAMMVWDRTTHLYRAIPSEGGHADFVCYEEQEFAFIKFLEEHKTSSWRVSWEDVLSGDGIKYLYRFLGTQQQYPETSYSKEIAQAGLAPDKISYYAEHDPHAHDTFTWYIRLYARCAKNFALETLARGGIYIAGGIAAKNVSMFLQPSFMQEFTACGKQKKLLEQIPISVIADYKVSLYGAAEYLRLMVQGTLR